MILKSDIVMIYNFCFYVSRQEIITIFLYVVLLPLLIRSNYAFVRICFTYRFLVSRKKIPDCQIYQGQVELIFPSSLESVGIEDECGGPEGRELPRSS